ncbi:potassium channel family protein [Streptosporangium sp. NPDC000396]|uniref:potassium channel family protein n=1 Tax=Streptosporangium sp. NPDC000396 TaxID=3366185 RepID=UPI0036CC85AE
MSEVPLILASLAFLAAFAVLTLAPGLPPGWVATCRTTLLGTWLLFAADITVRLALAPDRRAFLRRNWLALLTLVVPTLRPLLVVGVLGRASIRRRPHGLDFNTRVAAYAGLTTLLLGLTAALAVLNVERAVPGANITGFGDAVWWAVSTIATTGFGDTYPVTGKGRLIGGVLMLGGVCLLGVVAASFASWFVSRFGEEADAREAETLRLLNSALEELRDLRRSVERLQAGESGESGESGGSGHGR